jgi:CTP:molybdopterin cytidylyltransferase MocA
VGPPIVAAVVLAAGGGRRYGMPKALVEYDGSLLVERAVRTARAVCDPVLVVLGAQAVDVWRQADLGGAAVLANKDWESGMASSLRTGLDGLRGWPGRVDAALITLVDMPGMTTGALQQVVAVAAPDVLAVATYDGVRSHPVLLGREHWTGVIETATGDEGARRYLAEHSATGGVTEVDCTGLADPTDLDVPPSGVPSAP